MWTIAIKASLNSSQLLYWPLNEGNLIGGNLTNYCKLSKLCKFKPALFAATELTTEPLAKSDSTLKFSQIAFISPVNLQ